MTRSLSKQGLSLKISIVKRGKNACTRSRIRIGFFDPFSIKYSKAGTDLIKEHPSFVFCYDKKLKRT